MSLASGEWKEDNVKEREAGFFESLIIYAWKGCLRILKLETYSVTSTPRLNK